MKCDDARFALPAFFDGELDPVDCQLMETHLESCAPCRYELAELASLRRILRSCSSIRAPATLAGAVVANLDAQRNKSGTPRRTWALAALASAILVVTSALVTSSWRSYEYANRLERHDVISAYARSLLDSEPVAIASSDRHTVKPWLTARVPYAPSVQDATVAGFELLGARIDVIAERQVAAIVYRRRKHLINLFVWPTQRKTGTALEYTAERGYNVATWSDNGLVYYLVSDLNRTELGLLQAQFGSGG